MRMDAPAPPPDAAPRDAARPADAGGGLGRPFGTHGGYHPEGVLFPGRGQAELDAAVAAFYGTWTARYLEPACAAGQWRVKSTPSTEAHTVSEAHGYGMLLTVIMAGQDPDARARFDGLFAYFDQHRSSVDAGLMAWAQDAACRNVMGDASATDGDLDIAYALLLADRQWGSAGPIDYAREARRVIDAILAAEVHPAGSLLIGDWAGPDDEHHDGTRPSDFATSHLAAFARATGVARWDEVVTKTYDVIEALQTGHAAMTGLLPDFAVEAPTPTPRPAPSGWLEGSHDGHYAWNACRTPWRIATDYLMSGEPRARRAVRRINDWIRAATGDRPARVRDGYRLDGTAFGTSAELAFVAPFAVAAMVEPASGSNQAWLDALWDELVGRAPSDYYGDSIKLLAMIVVSGNWWVP